MQFAHRDLGYQQAGNVVEVTLSGNAANVRLLDSSNFQNYRSGRQHRYYGGLVRRSPTHLTVPHSGHWHVVVDMQGLRGQARSSLRVIPREALSPLPEYRPQSRSPLAELVQDDYMPADGTSTVSQPKEWDVFVSHATEDKDDIVRPLVAALVAADLRVWYADFELRIGDSLRRKIDAGLARSRFGVVVLSPPFFAKNWPQYELDGLVTGEMAGRQRILPLWHKLTKQEVIAFSPSLADRMARSTAQYTVEEIAQEIADVVRNRE